MTKYGVIFAAVLVTTAACSAQTPENGETAMQTVEITLTAYEVALNASDVDTIVALYADDGVFMPQHFPAAVGRDNIRAAYGNVFNTISLNIEFEIDEVEQLSDNWAIARTRSAGEVIVHATGESGPEANQELFLLRRDDDAGWQIARYIFTTLNPPQP
ncbi:YybH family protein [Hyphobacterium sp.]|uniref:YybH family protein n=1 Tax=Hyphobacterium sp. TaxID=2004662 RepID=UPI003BAC9A2E